MDAVAPEQNYIRHDLVEFLVSESRVDMLGDLT